MNNGGSGGQAAVSDLMDTMNQHVVSLAAEDYPSLAFQENASDENIENYHVMLLYVLDLLMQRSKQQARQQEHMAHNMKRRHHVLLTVYWITSIMAVAGSVNIAGEWTEVLPVRIAIGVAVFATMLFQQLVNYFKYGAVATIHTALWKQWNKLNTDLLERYIHVVALQPTSEHLKDLDAMLKASLAAYSSIKAMMPLVPQSIKRQFRVARSAFRTLAETNRLAAVDLEDDDSGLAPKLSAATAAMASAVGTSANRATPGPGIRTQAKDLLMREFQAGRGLSASGDTSASNDASDIHVTSSLKQRAIQQLVRPPSRSQDMKKYSRESLLGKPKGSMAQGLAATAESVFTTSHAIQQQQQHQQQQQRLSRLQVTPSTPEQLAMLFSNGLSSARRQTPHTPGGRHTSGASTPAHARPRWTLRDLVTRVQSTTGTPRHVPPPATPRSVSIDPRFHAAVATQLQDLRQQQLELQRQQQHMLHVQQHQHQQHQQHQQPQGTPTPGTRPASAQPDMKAAAPPTTPKESNTTAAAAAAATAPATAAEAAEAPVEPTPAMSMPTVQPRPGSTFLLQHANDSPPAVSDTTEDDESVRTFSEQADLKSPEPRSGGAFRIGRQQALALHTVNDSPFIRVPSRASPPVSPGDHSEFTRGEEKR